MDLLLIRHAEPVHVEDAEGPADPPLHRRGHQQAAALAAWLSTEPIDAVISSPLRRARETAEPLARALDRSLTELDGVAEWDRHETSYIPMEELRALKDDRWDAIVNGGYTDDAAAFTAQITTTLRDLIDANPGRRLAVVCHGGVINHYVCDVLGIEPRLFFEPRYASITRVAASRRGVRSVVSLNETAHLRGLLDRL